MNKTQERDSYEKWKKRAKKFFALNNKAGYGAVHLQADEQKEMTRGYVKSTHEHSKNKYL